MNNTTDIENSSDIDGYAYYSMGFSLGVLLLIIIISLISYYCSRRALHNFQSHQANAIPGRNRGGGFLAAAAAAMERSSTVINMHVGLDEAVLNTYPVLLYSQAKLHKADSTISCCSICLADYKDTDSLRLLPDCGHFFHRKCIDPWLRLNPSCPVCRTSPLPTPLPTPLAEVAPLATTTTRD